MVAKIILSVVCFVLFAFIFVFKLIKKNDTTYLTILSVQAIGILLNFIQIIFHVMEGAFFTILIIIFCIVIPIAVFIVEEKGINISEYISIGISKMLLFFGNTRKAKYILLKLVSKYDKSYLGHKMLAEVYEKEGGMRKAIDEYIKVLDIKGNDHKSYFKISKLLNDLDRKDEAIQMLGILVKKRPELFEASKMLGDLLMEQKKYKEAAYSYILAIKHNPEDAELYYNLGIAYCRINEFPLAKQCFEKTIEANSNFYNAYYRLGQIALLYRDIENAENYFTQSMYEETEAKSFFQLAKIYMIKNDKNKAIMFINKAIEANQEFYTKMENEPIFISIKSKIEKPVKNENPKVQEESEKEKSISEYLDDTYNLTKKLNEKQNKQ